MAHLKKRKGTDGGHVWYVQYKENGKWKRTSCQTSNKRIAQDFLRKFQNHEDEGRLDLLTKKKKPLTLGEFYDRYIEHAKTTHSKLWLHNKKLIFENYLFPYFDKNTLLKNIRQVDIESYRAQRLRRITKWSQNAKEKKTVSKRTVNIEVNCLMSLLRQAVDWGELEDRFLPRIKKLEEIRGRVRFLSWEEIQTFRTALEDFPQEMMAYAFLMLYAGLRSGEALNLRWVDVDFERRGIWVTPRAGWTPKSKKGRVVPLPQELLAFLQERRQEIPEAEIVVAGEQYTPYMLKRHFGEVIEAAGLSHTGENKVTAHTLRHTYASHLVMKGVPLYTVAALLGHSSLETTQIYAHLAPDHLQKAVQEISY